MVGPAPFHASTERLGGQVVLRVNGDFDLLGVEPFELEVERAAGSGSERVVLDLRGLTFIDSSGLRAVITANETLAGRGLSVSFLKPPDRLWRVFSVTGTDAILPFDDSLEAEIEPPRHENWA